MAKNVAQAAKELSSMQYIRNHTPGEAYPLIGLVLGICGIAGYNLLATAKTNSDIVVNKAHERPFLDNSFKSESKGKYDWKIKNQKKVWSL
jgi:hypothetical protein